MGPYPLSLASEGPWQPGAHAPVTRGPVIFIFLGGGPNSRAGQEAGGGPPPSRPRIPALWLHVPERYAGVWTVSIPVLLPVRLSQRRRSHAILVEHKGTEGGSLAVAQRYERPSATS